MDYPIVIEGRERGRLTESRDGLYTVFRAECPRREGLIRLWLHGGGQSACLGVLAPEGEGLVLTRRLSRLARAAFPAVIEVASDRPQEAGPAVPPPPPPQEPVSASGEPNGGEGGWRALPDGSLLHGDGRLALPAALPPRSPLAGRLTRIRGQDYLVFRL